MKHTRTLSEEVRSFVPLVMVLIHLLLLCLASLAQAEHSFSSLRRLKTWLRSTLSQQRLNFVAVCHIHQAILNLIDTDALLKDFVRILNRQYWNELSYFNALVLWYLRLTIIYNLDFDK